MSRRRKQPAGPSRALVRVREVEVEAVVEEDRSLEKPLPDPLGGSAQQYTDRSRAEGTRTVYEKRYRLFALWCEANGRISMPASAETLIGYFTYMADDGRLDRRNPDRPRGLSVSSIQLALAAIVRLHERDLHPDKYRAWSAHRDPTVIELLRGIRRAKGVAPQGKKPILVDALTAMICATPSSTLIGARDRAILAIGFSGAFRRSELVALNIEDLTVEPKGLRVLIGRSKTDQEGAGQRVGIPRKSDKTICPVELVSAWVSLATKYEADMTKGALFRRVDRWNHIGSRLKPQQVARTVTNALARIGTDDLDKYGAHSLRAGLATSAYLAGKKTNSIKTQGRWKSTQTLDRYIRDLGLFEDNAADGL